MNSPKNVLTMTADDVTHLFRSTEKCVPKSRGNRLNIEAYNALLGGLHALQQESPSADPSSSSLASSSSDIGETGRGVRLPASYFNAVWKADNQQECKLVTPFREIPLDRFVRPGAALTNELAKDFLQYAKDALILLYREPKDLIWNEETELVAIKTYIAAKGYSNYVQL